MFENIAVADLAIGRSTVRQRILAILMSESVTRLHLREIQRRAGTSPGTASRELGKLVAVGLIDREAEGAQVYFRASSSPYAAMMRSMLIIAPAPAEQQARPQRLPRRKKQLIAESFEHVIANATISPAQPAVEPAPATEATPQRVIRPTAPERVRPLLAAVPELTPASRAEHRSSVDPETLQIARRIADSVGSVYSDADRLRGIYLVGERAAGSARTGAEIETVIVLDRVDRYGAELERTSNVIAALSHELKFVVSRVFVSESDWLGRDGPLAAIRAAAVEL